MNQSIDFRSHRSRAAVLVSLPFLTLFVGSSSVAVAAASSPTPPGYQRLTPVQPDPAWSATPITGACADIQANATAIEAELGKCHDKEGNLARLRAALAFCGNPLDFSVARPSDLSQVAGAKCAEAALRVESRGPVEAKGLAGSLVGPEVQDAIIRGLAAFLVDRAKAEALAAVAYRLQAGICDEQTGRQLLPLTCTLIGTADPYAVPISWGAIKATAERDLHELPLALLALSLPLSDGDQKKWKDVPEFAYVGVDFAEQVLIDRGDAVQLLVGLRSRYLSAAADCKAHPAGCSMLLTGIATEVVAPKFDVGSQKKDLFLKVATRLIVERARGDKLIPSDAVSSASWAGPVYDMASRFLQALSAGKETSSAVPAPAVADAAHKDVRTLTATMRVGDNAISVARLLIAGLPSVGESFGLSRDTISRIDRAVPAAGNLVVTARQGEYLTTVIAAGDLIDILAPDGTPAWVRRYLPFVGELAQAKDPAEVEKVLQAAAAPVGSYRGKRGDGNRRVTINGYLGVSGGWEWLAQSSVPHAVSFRGGMFAPVGVEASIGVGKASSLGLFLSVIDLGAVVDFRTSSETETQGSGMEAVTVEKKPVLGFDQVFAPGLYFVWGIHEVPLVLGAGASLTPNLRRVTFVGSQTTEEVTALRVGAFLAIDITILPL